MIAHKRLKQLAVIFITVLLSVLLLLQADTKNSMDARIGKYIKGGTYKTRKYPQWKLYQYKTVSLPRKYPFKFAPYQSYVLIDKYTQVGSDRTHNTLTFDPNLYKTIKPEADSNRREAKKILKRLKVRGKGKKAYKKIYKYCKTGKYIKGIKTAKGFFEKHGGDCAAHSSAFYVLCKVQGIPVRFCIGETSGLHAWNRVKVKKQWYWVDTTYGYGRSKDLWEDHKAPMETW